MKNIIASKFVGNRSDYIVSKCNNKNVLHIGACDAPYTNQKFPNKKLLHQKLESVCKTLVGIDIEETSVMYLASKGINIELCSIEEYKPNKIFDVVIFGETIEHLHDFNNFLTSLKKVCTANHTLVITTTPNAFFLVKFLDCFANIEYQHKDHTCIFSPVTIMQLFKMYDFSVVDLKFAYIERDNYGMRSIFSRYVCKLFPMLGENLVLEARLNKP